MNEENNVEVGAEEVVAPAEEVAETVEETVEAPAEEVASEGLEDAVSEEDEEVA